MRAISLIAKALAAVEVVLELLALHELHGDESNANPVLRLAIFIDCDDMRMIEPPGRLGLTLETREQFAGLRRPPSCSRPDRLDRNGALDEGVEPFVDDTHRAVPQLAPDLVLARAWTVRLGHLSPQSLDGIQGPRAPIGPRGERMRYADRNFPYLYLESIS